LEEPERSDIFGVDPGDKGREHLVPLRWDDELIVAAAIVHSVQSKRPSNLRDEDSERRLSVPVRLGDVLLDGLPLIDDRSFM
jgi:hypothetical protein